jgi:peptidoglycan-associated lipoprotein
MHGRRGGAISTALPPWAITRDADSRRVVRGSIEASEAKEGIVTDLKPKNGASWLLLLTTFVLYLAVLTACTTEQASPVTPVGALPGQAPASSQTATASPPPEVASPAASTITPGSLRDFQENVGDQVHFDYDRAELNPAALDTVRKQAAWLQKYPSVTLVIEGHADERGTREYNLALGARRAAAVMSYLAIAGVSAARLETVSYGKERPICTQSDELCWQQNRRGVSTIRTGAAAVGS